MSDRVYCGRFSFVHVWLELLESEVHFVEMVQQPYTSADSPLYSFWRRPLTNVLADMDGGMAAVDADA
jgi:hypothetical protein